ncbi:S8 family serine peptidase [Dactylosporangium sp. NPDC050588]|uniref:S8 family serine peptidase n=1 Tax=Dactylosporangium sp. NPDC050588 TaxID=3157211 RepID=UPI0033D7C21F
MPRALSTSRKLTPPARTAMRTWPARSSPAASRACSTVRPSRVPSSPGMSRHGPSGGLSSSVPLTVARRGILAVPPCRSSAGSPLSRAAGSAAMESAEVSRSTRTKCPGFSDCADRTRPCTAAAAGSRTSSPTASRVRNTSRDAPNAGFSSHSCTSASARAVSAWAAATVSGVPALTWKTVAGMRAPLSAAAAREARSA